MKAEELINAIRKVVKSEIPTNDGQKKSVKVNTELIEIIKDKVTYDDVKTWIKNHRSSSSYNGVYLNRKEARFFDKGSFCLRICFAIDQQPQTGDADPAVVFTYEQLDDTLRDLLSDNTTILIKLP